MPPKDPPVEIPRDRRVELGLMFSHTCNITCRHCGIFSSPQNKNKMRLEDARRWIMDAARIPIIKQINFTGGELFSFRMNTRSCLRSAARWASGPASSPTGFGPGRWTRG